MLWVVKTSWKRGEERYRNNDSIEPYFPRPFFCLSFLETRLAREHHLHSLSNFTHRVSFSLFLSFPRYHSFSTILDRIDRFTGREELYRYFDDLSSIKDEKLFYSFFRIDYCQPRDNGKRFYVYSFSVLRFYIYKKKKNRTQTRSKWCTSLSEGETNTGNSLVVNHFAKTNCSILYEDCRKETRQVTFSNFYRRGAVL